MHSTQAFGPQLQFTEFDVKNRRQSQQLFKMLHAI